MIAILLARQLAPHAYGAYALAFEVFLLLSVLYGALVLEPMSVFGSSVYRNSLRGYMGVLLRFHIILSIAVLSIVGVSAWVVHEVAPGRGLSSALIGVAIATPCVLLFWLVRRAFYVKLIPRQAALGALVYFAVLVSGLLLVYRLKLLSPLVAFLLMAAGAIVTAPIMLARLKPGLESEPASPTASEVLHHHWSYGRWALGSSLTIWLSGAIYYPLLGGFRGLADAGAMKALMNFNSPVGQVFAALSLLFLPYTARVYHQEGTQGTHRLVWRLTALYAGGTLLYWIIVVSLREPIVHHLYAGRYMNVTDLVPWVALGSVLRISATAQAVTLRAMNSPALVFVAYSASCVVAIIVGIPCTWAFGLPGAVFTLILSSGVALTVTLIIVHRRYPLLRRFDPLLS